MFGLGGILFQISCSNSDETSSPQTNNKIVYLKQDTGSPIEIWTADIDGSNQAIVPIDLPTNVEYSYTNMNRSSVKISPDGQKIIFIGRKTDTNLYAIYSCDFSGSNVQEIISMANPGVMEIGGVN